MRIKICVLLILVASTILAQESVRTKMNGKITANTIDLEGVYVINLKTEKSSITDSKGFFSIAAYPGDTLLFSSVNLKRFQICLEQKYFQNELFVVKMELKINQLNEVLIRRYDNINAVALGISPSGILNRTQEERKLYTATSTAGDALLNFMSGRTAMIKKEIQVEKKLSYIELIDNMFAIDHFINDFKIPADYVKGFKYYMVENDIFTNILKQKNKTTIDFLMGELANKYKDILSSEK